MGKLSEEIGRIINLLEDAKEEQDWSNIQNIQISQGTPNIEFRFNLKNTSSIEFNIG